MKGREVVGGLVDDWADERVERKAEKTAELTVVVGVVCLAETTAHVLVV